jgi:hypothetical protein
MEAWMAIKIFWQVVKNVTWQRAEIYVKGQGYRIKKGHGQVV